MAFPMIVRRRTRPPAVDLGGLHRVHAAALGSLMDAGLLTPADVGTLAGALRRCESAAAVLADLVGLATGVLDRQVSDHDWARHRQACLADPRLTGTAMTVTADRKRLSPERMAA